MPDMPVDLLPHSSYPDAMEARVAVLEHIAKTNAAAFDRLDQRMERLEHRLDQRLDQLLDRMDRRFDLVERRFEAVDRRFEASDRRYDTLNAHHRADFLWLIAIQIATIGSLLTAMARGFHWI